ncbi:hypothetical protein B0T14DRAFT_249301 [Immersiella caudata]|uniref:Heterokaryon incompatibility domain-containing protein n=1 Tax=Immersiella caudata TaxID=314043 RepID=A0AA39WJI2_9PEZI|nr:hypothetical protein B0T14DRAFT_249301 [Immersiella caudata]
MGRLYLHKPQDEAEKVSQIPLMEVIYTWATIVYVWLGEGTESSDRAMKTLSQLGSLVPPLPLSIFAARTESARKSQDLRWWVQNSWNVLPNRSLCVWHLSIVGFELAARGH